VAAALSRLAIEPDRYQMLTFSDYATLYFDITAPDTPSDDSTELITDISDEFLRH